VALAVDVIGGKITKTQFGDWQIFGRAELCSTGDETPFVCRPVLYFKDQALAERVAQERYVLVCGVPILRPLHNAQKPWLKPCADFAIEVINSAQVCQYRPMLKQSP